MSPPSGSGPERVYVALAPGQLPEVLAAGRLPADAPVHAVTPALRGLLPDDDVEEHELAASLDAADSSLRLVAAAQRGGVPGPARRLVLAADVPAAGVSPRPAADGDPAEAHSRVLLAEPVPLGAVVSAHVDEAAAEPDVAAAARVLRAHDEGGAASADADGALDAAQVHHLLWYDASELAALADELSGPAGG